ncbi:MAG TPA: hypothetical protein VFO31_20100 [Vicinamibacterales bacterium]|nr:hypothetical protein [Vicinamibacterales bacterium]
MTLSIHRAIVLVAACLTLAAGTADAQDAPKPSRSLVAATFPRWDAGGSIGFLAVKTSDTLTTWADWEQKAEYRFDLGRYWTTHLKTDVAVSASNPWQDYESLQVTVPGVPRGFVYQNVDRQLFNIAPAVTWQFRENTFMHPYVSGGVRLGLLQEHRYNESDTIRSGAITYTVPHVDERRTVVLARPFFAAGFKSYLSRSVFVRTEGRAGFAQDGMRQLTGVIGIGVDF